MSNHQPIISVSGLRGIVGESLTPETVCSYVAAYSSCQENGAMVLSRDGRPSGDALARMIAGVLQWCGRDVRYANIAATPTVGRLVRQYGTAGGIQITASHNPAEYNGLKLFRPDGRVLTADEGASVMAHYQQGTSRWCNHESLGKFIVIGDAIVDHLDAVLAQIDVERIQAKRYRVVLDSNSGAGSLLALPLLERLGCDVIAIGDEPTGQFRHAPEPTATNLATVAEHVREIGADIAFCQDPDADRLALIDATGHYIGEEYTLAICVNHILRSRPGPVVTNCSTSRMTEDIAGQYGVACHRSKVGEAHVADLMIEVKAVFGGEGNGGPIDPSIGYIRDSFVGIATVLDAMATRQLSLQELVDELPRYFLSKSTVTLPAATFGDASVKLERHFSHAAVNRLDGLRLDWPDRWLLVRASNTEPIVRIVVEGPTQEIADQLAKEAADVLSSYRKEQ